MSQIVLRKDTRELLRDMFKISDSMLSLALHFKSNSLRARRVRSYAVNQLKAFPIL